MKTYRVFFAQSRFIDIKAHHVDYDPVMSVRLNFVDEKGTTVAMFFATDIKGYADTASLNTKENK